MMGSSTPRLGILLVDSLDAVHRQVAGDYDRLYTDVFERAGAHVELVDARSGGLPDHDACDGWVIGGSRHSVGDDLDWLGAVERWVEGALDRDVRLIGICFGHQLIAHCAGGVVGRAPGGWSIGVIDYRLDPTGGPAPLVEGGFRLVASHQDQVLIAPEGARVFASSMTCPVAGYTIGDRVSCVQGHPEFPPALAASLYLGRRQQLAPDQLEAALASLAVPTDGGAIARWLVARVAATLEGA